MCKEIQCIELKPRFKLILSSSTITLFSKLQNFRKYFRNLHFFRKISKILSNFESIFEKYVNFESIFEKFIISKKMSIVDEVTISNNGQVNGCEP